jgi:hypothetical protein
MTGLTSYSAENVLNYIVGKTAMPTLPTGHLALFTAVGTDAGTGFTEVSGGSYARVAGTAADWSAATGLSPSTITNSVAFSFPSATASWGTIIAFGIYDAATGGNLLAWDYLGADSWYPFTCTDASPGVLTAIGMTAGSSPTLANGALVIVSAEYGGSLPTGLVAATQYTVAGLTNDTFNVGTATTSTGSGLVRQLVVQAIPSGVVATFGPSSLTLVLS